MIAHDPNKLFKAMAKLRAIKSNMKPDSHYTNEKYVYEYNSTVNEIGEVMNDELLSFLVPRSEIKPKVLGRNSAGTRYSTDNWTETQFILIKLDAVINYLQMLIGQDEPKKPIGFGQN